MGTIHELLSPPASAASGRNMANALRSRIADISFTKRLAQEGGNRGGCERFFDRCGGIVQLPVQGAKVRAVGFQSERTGLDSFDGIDRSDNLEDRQFRRGANGLEAAATSASAGDHTCARERIQNFRKVIERNPGFAGKVFRGTSAWADGERDHGPQCVFGGLRKHRKASIHDIRIVLSLYSDPLKFLDDSASQARSGPHGTLRA